MFFLGLFETGVNMSISMFVNYKFASVNLHAAENYSVKGAGMVKLNTLFIFVTIINFATSNEFSNCKHGHSNREYQRWDFPNRELLTKI